MGLYTVLSELSANTKLAWRAVHGRGPAIAVAKSLGLYRQCSGPRVVGRWIGSAGRGIADTAISSKPLARSYGY